MVGSPVWFVDQAPVNKSTQDYTDVALVAADGISDLCRPYGAVSVLDKIENAFCLSVRGQERSVQVLTCKFVVSTLLPLHNTPHAMNSAEKALRINKASQAVSKLPGSNEQMDALFALIGDIAMCDEPKLAAGAPVNEAAAAEAAAPSTNTEAAEAGDWFVTDDGAFRLSDVSFICAEEEEVTVTRRRHLVHLTATRFSVSGGDRYEEPVTVDLAPEQFERLRGRLTSQPSSEPAEQ